MNFIFISPQFPKTYWNFCDRLKRNGINVLGIGDSPYDELSEELKNSLTEYYRLDSLENYDEVVRAVGYFTFRYGKIDWIESNNEYWLGLDAKIRTDFNITTGKKADEIKMFQSKSLMKEFYKKAGVPAARWHLVSNLEQGLSFIREVGYPVIVKPDIGVGASHTYKLSKEEQVREFYANLPDIPYLMEEFIEGSICSYDGVSGPNCEILFESSNLFPPSIMDIVNNKNHLSYCTLNHVPETLSKIGHRVIEAFSAKNRFFHLEFFKLTKEKPGLGKVGDYVALEVNMRPAGGYTPDMINFANSVDIYQIWADMVAFGECHVDLTKPHYYAVYASRRDEKQYLHSHEEILERYGAAIVMQERMPEILSAAMGNQMYTAKLETSQKAEEFVSFIQQEVSE
ncbi:MAG TPA: carbamoylphosphate synthase large subunit [Firmicutes bacterium]|nr:carbamoylphosphate synthase large subunit [Bacillota bacterium]